jgi:hypothetical protein
MTAVQHVIGTEIAGALSKKFGTKVEVGRVDLGLLNRIIIDDVYFYDQSNKLMIKAARLSVKIEVIPLTHGKISINSAQLFSFHATLYKKSATAKPNYQFLLDSLASKDTTSKSSLNLRVNSFIARRGFITYDRYDLPLTHNKFNNNHLNISDFSAHIILKELNSDSLNINIKKMSLEEASGLTVNDITLKFEANHKQCLLSGLRIQMPNTDIRIDTTKATYRYEGNRLIPATLQYYGALNKSAITPYDLRCFVPNLKNITSPIFIHFDIYGTSTQLRIKYLDVRSIDYGIRMICNGSLSNWGGSSPNYYARVNKIDISSKGIAKIYETAANKKKSLPKILSSIGRVIFEGEVGGIGESIYSNGVFNTGAGDAEFSCGIRKDGNFRVSLQTDNMNIGKLTNDKDFGLIGTKIAVKGHLKNNKVNFIDAKGKVYKFDYNNYTYKNLIVDGIYDNNDFNGMISMNDPNGVINIKGEVNLQSAFKKIKLNASVRNFNPSALKITDKWKNTSFNGNLTADFNAKDINDAIGFIDLKGFNMIAPNNNYQLDVMHLEAKEMNGIHIITLNSDFAYAELSGMFNIRTISQSITNFVGRELPTLPGWPVVVNHIHNNNFRINAEINKSDWINKILGVPLQLNKPLTVYGFIDDKVKKIQIMTNIPNFDYDGSHYENGELKIANPKDTLNCDISVKKFMANNHHFDIGISTNAINNRLTTVLKWTNNRKKLFGGKIATETQFYRNKTGKPTASVNVLPSHIIINDTAWNMRPSHIDYCENVLNVNDFTIEHNQQHIIINGVASNANKDSLIVDLHDADVQYILGVINFHAVEFSGLASGKVFVSSAFSNPSASTKLNIKNFKFENGQMGVLHANAEWNKKEKQLDINAIADDSPIGLTNIKGYISPSRNYIDLAILPHNTNIEFMNSFLGSVMDNIQGRTSGDLRLYGPLSNINLTGTLIVNGETKIKSLNTSYQLRNDTILLIPDEIEFRHTPIFDRNNNVAYIDGNVHHKHLTNLSYDLGVSTQNLLCYDFKDFDKGNFYGTIYAAGDVGIHGKSGQVTIDVNVTPQRNSIFVYNAANPDAITNQKFISWNEDDDTLKQKRYSINDDENKSKDESVPTNIYLNFLINCNQNATLKVMMDNNSGDYLALNGDGVIRATFYNKGAFNMFGTYTVDHGLYKLTIQNVIHKDFIFKQGGSIVFGGDPYEASLDLQAIYTVNSASLSDLNVGNSFSNNNIKVNCIMNLTGQPKKPMVSFDLDLPTVNADEKQMVRSIINSEEDMNQQVLYLLGIGRFYTQGTNNASTSNATTGTQTSQTSLAMQSLLSGTLSSQLNNMLSSLVNNNKWNFGANISTGNEGWNNAEYEGLLSGRLLNNRLLINGQFGYRDNAATTTTSFVGDFDIQYLLIPNGNLAIKGYNQTNDRYFTKSSLNTQGIGLVMKKDFNGLRDLFGIKKKNKKDFKR